MESRTGSSRHVRSEDLLPPPPIGKALAFGGVAAVAGAVAWALLLIFANLEHGALAWGIGGLVGFAIVKAGGYGQMLAVSAAVLAVLAIGTGKHISYTHQVDTIIDEAAQTLTAEMHAEVADDVKRGPRSATRRRTSRSKRSCSSATTKPTASPRSAPTACR